MKDFVKLENVRKIYQMGEVEIRDWKRRVCRDRRPEWCGKDNGIKYSWRYGYGNERQSAC